MLLDDTNPGGKPPDNELHDKLRCSRPVRLPRDGEMRPSSPLEASETLVTVLFLLQAIPSHLQQSVPPCHDLARPASWESPERNWRREVFSGSVQELEGDANEISSTIATLRRGKGNLLLLFLCEKWFGCMASC